MPKLGWVPSTQACTAEVTSTITYVFLLAAASAILLAMLLPIGGAVAKVMADSFQEPLTRSTLKLPPVATELT
jgi:hypothetical protein